MIKEHKNFGEIHAAEVMISEPLLVSPDDKISTTELLMLRKKIGGLPVVDKNKLVGIITQRDIRLARFAMSLDFTLVKDLMTEEPIVIKKDTTIKEILSIMFENNIERLPVVNENNQLIGLVLQQDILKMLVDYL